MLYIIKGCFNTPEYNAITKRCKDCEFEHIPDKCASFRKQNNMNLW